MNIGFDAKRFFHNSTGLGNYSRDLIRILSKYYPENKYFLYNPKKSKSKVFDFNDINVFEQLPKSVFFKKFKHYWRQKGILKDLIKDEITLFHGLSGELPIGIKRNNIKSIVTIHDLIFIRYPNLYSFFDRKIHYLKFKKAAINADKIIAISEQTKKDIITFFKIKPEKIEVIYQGCQSVFKQTYSELEKQSVANKFGLPKEFVLNVGTIEKRKNALLIVKAIRNCDTTLVLIGKKTKYAIEIEEYINTHKLEDKVLFLNGITSQELAIIYQLATIFVYPSLFEGFGIPIIEALYSKTPVISTVDGVFKEAGGPDTIYIDPNNEEELQGKIQLLLNDGNLRNEISTRGYEFVQRFNDEIIAKKIMDCYKNL